MAITGDGLFQEVKAALGDVQDPSLQEAALKPICEAIVAYITANAKVSVVNATVDTAALAAPNGPLTGAATVSFSDGTIS